MPSLYFNYKYIHGATNHSSSDAGPRLSVLEGEINLMSLEGEEKIEKKVVGTFGSNAFIDFGFDFIGSSSEERDDIDEDEGSACWEGSVVEGTELKAGVSAGVNDGDEDKEDNELLEVGFLILACTSLSMTGSDINELSL